MWNQLLDFLFPRHSLTGREGEWVTQEELQSIRVQSLTLTKEDLERRGLTSLDGVFAVAAYTSPLVRRAIQTLKYRRMRGVADALASLLSSALRTLCDFEETPVLCAVPLHWRRRFARGFNQAEVLAKKIAKDCGLEYHSLLRRVRHTGSQVGRDRSERRTALTDAFAPAAGSVPKHVLLIDDVCTTGTTLDQCARVLKEAGAQSVKALVVALD